MEKASDINKKYNIAISFLDVSSQNPVQVLESRVTGDNTYHFKCSQDGKYVFLVYDQTEKVPAEEIKEIESRSEERKTIGVLEESQLTFKNRKANFIDVTNLRLAVFDINTLDKISDTKINGESQFPIV